MFDETWIAIAASVATGLLIGLERERNPTAKAGMRTFTLIALAGALAALVGSSWTVPVGLAAIAAMLVAAHVGDTTIEDRGTTTIAAACVCYLLGALAGLGQPGLAGALGIGVTALLYFKPELEGFSAALKRGEQVSALQFLVASFIVLPLLPDRAFGPYEVLNPRNIWLMVVLIVGVGLASYVALRIVGERHGVILSGILGGMVSSTATTVLHARRGRESPEHWRVAAAVVPLANLVPLVRIAVLCAVVAPSLLGALAPILGAALACGMAVTALSLRALHAEGSPPLPEGRNPAEFGTALRFGAVYAVVLLATAWLSDLAGIGGLLATAVFSGLVDVDPIVLSALNLFGDGRVDARHAVAAIALAYAANVAFKLGVVLWYERRLALRVLWPLLATVVAGAAAFSFAG